MTGSRQTVIRLGLGALIVAVVLALTRPWTIRPIESSWAEGFDAEAYVESIWPRVIRAADSTAIDLANATRSLSPIADEGQTTPARRALFVRGTGIISDVDLKSRAGVAHVRISGLETPGVALQVGPVLRGTALRDALGFVRFTDFANQFDFAAVSSALNRRVLETVLGPIDVESLTGQGVTFVGAAAVGGPGSDTPLEIVPLTLHVGEARR